MFVLGQIELCVILDFPFFQRAVMDFRLSEPSWYTVGIVLLLGTMAVFLASRKK